MKEVGILFYVSEISGEAPETFRTPLQEKVYRALAELAIPFERVDTDEAVTMEDCVLIDEKLDMKMVKTLFLCNRQKTAFYLFVTAGDKPFRAKDFSAALGVPRVSFAPAELMSEKLGTKVGAATIFSALLPSAADVRFVIDSDVLREEWYGCSDGTTTGYMKVSTEKIVSELMPYTGRCLEVVEMSR